MSSWSSSLFNLYREAYRNHPSQVWVLAILTFINRLGTMVMPFLTIYLTTVLDFSLPQAGILSGSYGFGAMVGAYLTGKFSDKYGSRMAIIGSLFIAGVLMIVLQWMTSFTGFLFFLIFAGMFAEAYRPAVMSCMGSLVDSSNTGRTMALMRLAISTGMSMAPTIGGLVAVTYGYQWLFWVDGLTCIAATGYYLIFSEVVMPTKQEATSDQEEKVSTEVLHPHKDTRYLLFLLATFLAGFSFMQWFSSVPVFIKSHWGFDERYIGLMMGVSSIVIALFEMPVVHYLEKNKRIVPSTNFGLLMIGLSFVPFFFPPSLVLYLLAVLIWTFGIILFLSFNNATPLQMCTNQTRGNYMGWYWMTWGLCGILAPSIGLTIVENLGYHELWVLLIGLVGLSVFLHSLFAKKMR